MMNASVLVTEWGGGDGDIVNGNLQGTSEQQDRSFTGATYWDWKQSAQAGCGWSLYKCATGPDNVTQPNGPLDLVKLAVVSRVLPAAVAWVRSQKHGRALKKRKTMYTKTP